jgi:hypothetical protein
MWFLKKVTHCIFLKIRVFGWVLVAHVCNPSDLETRKIAVQSQPRQIVLKTLFQK